MTFKEAQENYRNAREHERRKVILKLLDKGYNASCRGGRGIKTYTSGGRIEPYDLRNFMWIEAKKGCYTYFISLNPFDTDPVSNSRHFLPDRLGICKYEGAYNADYVYHNMKVTDIDLPLYDKELDQLIRELEDL